MSVKKKKTVIQYFYKCTRQGSLSWGCHPVQFCEPMIQNEQKLLLYTTTVTVTVVKYQKLLKSSQKKGINQINDATSS